MIAPSLLILQISELLEFLNQSDTSDDLVVAGLVFLFVAVAGNISGKLEPGRVGRIAAGMLGSILLISGILLGVGMGSTPTPEATPPSDLVDGSQAVDSGRTSTPARGTTVPSTEPPPTETETPDDDVRVHSVSIVDIEQETTGACPYTMSVTGQIEIIGSGPISYEFVRSNGETSNLRSTQFATSGTVRDTWTFDAAEREPSISGSSGRWVALKITEPTEVMSAKMENSVECERVIAAG